MYSGGQITYLCALRGMTAAQLQVRCSDLARFAEFLASDEVKQYEVVEPHPLAGAERVENGRVERGATDVSMKKAPPLDFGPSDAVDPQSSCYDGARLRRSVVKSCLFGEKLTANVFAKSFIADRSVFSSAQDSVGEILNQISASFQEKNMRLFLTDSLKQIFKLRFLPWHVLLKETSLGDVAKNKQGCWQYESADGNLRFSLFPHVKLNFWFRLRCQLKGSVNYGDVHIKTLPDLVFRGDDHPSFQGTYCHVWNTPELPPPARAQVFRT